MGTPPGHIEDASGLACPLPILALARALQAQAPGAVVRLVATDAAAGPDVRAYCQSTGHLLLAQGEEGGRYWADVQKRPS